MYKQLSFKILIACYFLILFSCTNKENDVDVSSISIPYSSIRFDKEIFTIDTNLMNNGLEKIEHLYPEFSTVFLNELTGFAKNGKDSNFYQSFSHFIKYKDYRNLYDTVLQHFPNTTAIDNELELLFKHIKYYFPNEKWGKVYYFVSGLNFWSAITVDTTVGVGLDMYLGKQYPFYASVQLPSYQVTRCEPEYIVPNVCKAIYENNYNLDAEGKNLLDLMIARGKEMYFMQKMIPTLKPEIAMGYTKEQMEWCNKSEAFIWNYFIAQNLLYETNWQTILRYVNDAPTSTGMPPESPGNLGTWIGWQIVTNYMKNNSKTTLQELCSMPIHAQEFLKQSGYKPN